MAEFNHGGKGDEVPKKMSGPAESANVTPPEDTIETERKRGVLASYDEIWHVRARAVDGAEKKLGEIEELVKGLPIVERSDDFMATKIPALTKEQEQLQKKVIMQFQRYKDLMNQYIYGMTDTSLFDTTEEERERIHEAFNKGEKSPFETASSKAGIDRYKAVSEIEREARDILGFSYEGQGEVSDAQKAIRERHRALLDRAGAIRTNYSLYHRDMPIV